jgi:hypothetical protein
MESAVRAVTIARTAAEYAIFAATQRDGANFPDFFVARRSKTFNIRRFSLLELEKICSRRHHP